MSATTGYVPLDSDALAVFSSYQLNNYMDIAFVMLLLYDHVITLDKEVEWIWTLRWRLPKIIFIVNRYIITTCLLLYFIPYYIYPLPLSFCTWYNRLSLWIPILSFYPAQILMAIRVCSLYGNSKILVRILVTLWLSTLIYSVVLFKISDDGLATVFFYEFLEGCWTKGSKAAINVVVPSSAVFLSIDGAEFSSRRASFTELTMVAGILVLLTAYKLISYRNQMNRTVTVLARDSIVYCIIIFVLRSLSLYSDINVKCPLSFADPARCTTSIAVGRMMMNIRGLIFDDPKYTVHLQTMQFVRGSDSNAEVELSILDDVVESG